MNERKRGKKESEMKGREGKKNIRHGVKEKEKMEVE